MLNRLIPTKVKSSRESLKQFLKRSSPDIQQRVEDLQASGVKFSKSRMVKPTVIVGASWPSTFPGARRHVCCDCKSYVGLTADSGDAAHDKWPDVPVTCFDCAEKRARAADDKPLARATRRRGAASKQKDAS